MCITTISVGLIFGSVIRYSQKPKTVNLGAKLVGCFLEQIPTTKHKAKRNKVIAMNMWDIFHCFPAGNGCQKERNVRGRLNRVLSLRSCFLYHGFRPKISWPLPCSNRCQQEKPHRLLFIWKKDKLKLFKRWEFWKLAVTYWTSCPPFWHASARAAVGMAVS